MKAQVYSVETPSPGLVSILARPRGDDWLEDEMVAAKAAGVDVLVSALTEAEQQELGLLGEREAALAAGVEFIPLPIPDRGVPTLDQQTVDVFRRLQAAVAAGQHVAVHCRMGIGRSSLVIATLLGLDGIDGAAAFELLANVRGVPVPDTAEQRAWVQMALQTLR